jgi:hypothetical protein
VDLVSDAGVASALVVGLQADDHASTVALLLMKL